MPTTEAGKRLARGWNGELDAAIDAIEAEARAGAFEQRDELLDDLTAEWEAKFTEAVAAERARIRAAADKYPDYTRAAVLRVIDGEAAPAAEGQSTSSGAAEGA